MNGVLKGLLAAAALVVIGFGALLAVLLVPELWRATRGGIVTSDVVNVDPDNETLVRTFSLTGFERVGDGPVLRATLMVAQDFRQEGVLGSYAKSSSGNAVNMLFLEPGAPDRWLFDDNDRLITRTSSVSLVPLGESAQDQPEVAVLLLMVTADTNADQRLSDSDTAALALMHPDGRGLTTLLEVVSGNVTVLPDPAVILLSIEAPTGVELLRLDPRSFAILDRRTVDYPG